MSSEGCLYQLILFDNSVKGFRSSKSIDSRTPPPFVSLLETEEKSKLSSANEDGIKDYIGTMKTGQFPVLMAPTSTFRGCVYYTCFRRAFLVMHFSGFQNFKNMIL